MAKILKSDNLESTIISSTKDASLILSTRPSDVLTSRLTILSNGNVGIGEENPTFLSGSGLEIVRNGISTLRIENSSNSTSGEIRADTVGFRLDARGTDILSFATGGGERFRVGPAGQFGIGGATYGSSGEVFISGGGSAAPTWALIANANVSNSAAIAYSKLNLSTSIVNADISATAAIAVSKLAANTISGITLGNNLATLTLNTSGTGLSGSTTYNGSGATTFTVTSNATSANTASAIVARNASGDFSAGTITATLTGNSTGLSNSGYGIDISTSTYGSWRVTGSKGGYVGTEYSLNSNLNTLMFDSSGNGGLYNYQDWIFYFLKSNRGLGIMTSTTSSSYSLYVGGVTGAIYATGNIVAYSDERVKNNWTSLSSDFIERLSKVKSGTYNRIDKEGLRQVGVSAQSLREVIPEAVTEDKDNDNKLGVSYGNAALAACVELAKEIVALKEEIKNLKK